MDSQAGRIDRLSQSTHCSRRSDIVPLVAENIPALTGVRVATEHKVGFSRLRRGTVIHLMTAKLLQPTIPLSLIG
jgi:hypothetical protein